jgi:hypothetical protein
MDGHKHIPKLFLEAHNVPLRYGKEEPFEIDNPRAGFIPMPSRPPQEFWND